MAIEYQFYLAPRVTGTMPDGVTPCVKSALHQYVVPPEWFDELDSPRRSYSVCLVAAEPATHATLVGVTGVTKVFPGASYSAGQIRENLDTPLNTIFTTAQLNAMRTKAESYGIPCSATDLAGTATVRQLLRRIVRHHVYAQSMDCDRDTDLATFITSNLTATVGSLSAAVRTKVATWMQTMGLSTTWITGTTTVRQVVAYIHTNLPVSTIRFGGMEDF